MARTKSYTSPPKHPENQWFRDALAHCLDQTGRDWTFDAIAQEMMRAKVGGTYDKSVVQKMTTIRRIKLPEAAVISELTGYPMLDTEAEPDRTQEVKLISWISAGQLTAQDGVTNLDDYPSLYVAGLPPGRWVALRVDGTSMNKISPPDSVIIVNLDDTRLVDGKLYVVADETEGATYKAYDKKADPPFQPRSYVKTDPPEFVGSVRVVGRVYRTMLDL